MYDFPPSGMTNEVMTTMITKRHLSEGFIAGIIATLCIVAAFITSLFFTGGENWLYGPALLCLLAGLLIAVLARGPVEMPSGAPAWMLLAFSLYATVSLSWSLTPFPSLVTWLVYACLPLGFFGLSLSPRRDRFIHAAFLGLQAALALLGLWGVAQVMVLHANRAGYPLEDANNFAALMNLGLMPALAAMLTAPDRRRFIWTAAAAMAESGGLFATESRAGLLCFFILSLALFLMVAKDARPFLRRSLGVMAAMAALFTLLSLHAPDGGAAARLATVPALTGDEAAMNRPVLWRATLDMIAERPWTGTGFGSFYLAYPPHRPVEDRVSAGQWAHNDPLQFAAEMGLSALLLFYAFAAGFLWRTYRALSQCKDMPAAIAGPACGILAVLLHAHVEFQFYLMPVLIVTGVWLAEWYRRGAACLPPAQSWTALPVSGGRRPAYAAFAIVIAGLFAVPAIRCAAAGYYFTHAVAAMRDGKPATFTRLLDKADAVGPASFVDGRVQRAGLYIDLLRTPEGLFAGKDQHAMIQYVQTTLALAGQTMPLWSDVNDRRAALYTALQNRMGPDWERSAEGEYRIALGKNPLDLKARGNLIKLVMARGDAGEAYSLIDEGLARPHPAADQPDMLALREKLARAVALKKQYEDHKP